MRTLFGCLAVLLGAVSVALAARYGYKGADTIVDGVISAEVFGLIALCAFIFDAAAVRLWFMRHRLGAGIVGVIAAAALVVTFTNSLGAIAGRADTTQADRVRAKDDVATDRAELMRITKERAGLAAFTPATDEDVKAAREAVAVAELVRAAECEKRGPKCRGRVTEEQTKRDALATALANKAATDKAAKLDDSAALVRTRIAKAPSVQNANPLGAALEQLIGAGAAVLTAWQQAVVAGVFELCLVGVMVIFELLGQSPELRAEAAAVSAASEQAANRSTDGRPTERSARPALSRMLVGWSRVSRTHEQLQTLPVEQTPPKLIAPPKAREPSAFEVAKTDASEFARQIEARKAGVSQALAPVTPPGPVLPPTPSKGSVRAFALDCLLPAEGRSVEMSALLREYRAWCKQKSLEAKDVTGFAEDMRAVCDKAGIEIETKGKRVLCRHVRLEPKPAAETEAYSVN